MNLTLPDLTGPAQPPTDDRHALLRFAMLTATVYIVGVMFIVALAQLTR